jgi:hypothetical protein
VRNKRPLSRIGWVLVAIAAVAVSALATGCGALGSRRAEAIAPASPSLQLDSAQAALAPPGPALGVQQSGEVLAWLSSKPAQPVRGTAELDAYLVTTDGQPVIDATVAFDSDMTNMSHGLNLVKARPNSAGHYSGSVRFQMPGPWRVIAIVDRPGQQTMRLRFTFNVNFQ